MAGAAGSQGHVAPAVAEYHEPRLPCSGAAVLQSPAQGARRQVKAVRQRGSGSAREAQVVEGTPESRVQQVAAIDLFGPHRLPRPRAAHLDEADSGPLDIGPSQERQQSRFPVPTAQAGGVDHQH